MNQNVQELRRLYLARRSQSPFFPNYWIHWLLRNTGVGKDCITIAILHRILLDLGLKGSLN